MNAALSPYFKWIYYKDQAFEIITLPGCNHGQPTCSDKYKEHGLIQNYDYSGTGSVFSTKRELIEFISAKINHLDDIRSKLLAMV